MTVKNPFFLFAVLPVSRSDLNRLHGYRLLHTQLKQGNISRPILEDRAWNGIPEVRFNSGLRIDIQNTFFYPSDFFLTLLLVAQQD